MNTVRIKDNKILSLGLRILLCALVIFWMGQTLLAEGLMPCESWRDYSFQSGTEDLVPVSEGRKIITQELLLPGERLNHLSLYTNQASEASLTVSLMTAEGKTLAERTVSCGEFAPGTWNPVSGFSAEGLKRNGRYILQVSSEEGLSMLSLCAGETDDRFGTCTLDGEEGEVRLAVGVDCTHIYFTAGRAAEFGFTVLAGVMLAAGLCFGILRFGKLLAAFKASENRAASAIPAACFAFSTALLFNPLALIRNVNLQFKRVLGEGMMWDVDVSRRTSNFFLWILVFAAAFGVFWLVIQYLRQRGEHPEAKGMIRFLDHFMIVYFCTAVFHGITYFQNETAGNPAFSFTYSAMMLVAMISVAYLALGLYKKISLSDYSKIHFMLAALSIPAAALLPVEWEQGRAVFGIWCVLALGAILVMLVTGKRGIGKRMSAYLSWGTVLLAFFPFLTSAFIEGVNILNQHSAFVAHPARYYLAATGIYLVFAAALSLAVGRKKGEIRRWKGIAAPVLVIGVACLSVQIPLVSYYHLDLFEGANAGILVSDYLHFGVIPNVEHYGGHMMTDVWEALVYALLNQDFSGAFVSPYAGMLVPVLTVLFYWFVKEAWDEDAALYTALFFPFLDYWSYFGLGMLICLAAVAYVRRNTWPRAIALWGAFVWCALYRLDMGFAYGVAAVVTMTAWLFHTRNGKAVKQVLLSLVGWALLMVGLWCVLCLAKGINPITRMIELVLINFSNQNWAYADIGNPENTLFAWFYLILPLTAAGCLLYTTFSKVFREELGEGRWILMMMLGWAYFGNFSRGLVRHSLAEGASLYVTWTTTWTAYLFLALFLAGIRKKIRLFIPAFMALMLLNTLFLQGENFAGTSTAEKAMNTPAEIIEGWTATRFSEEDHRTETYWERIGRAGKVENRVNLSGSLQTYAAKYRGVINALLEPGETYADFINKPLLYCLLERRDPAYVSQSPLQLSGEFTQQQFIEEIRDVPIVLMPMKDFRASVILDSLNNAYRYYLVSEYIYQEFEPLCRYGDEYAIWARKGSVEKYREKLRAAFPETECLAGIADAEGLECSGLTLTETEEGLRLTATGPGPRVSELQKGMDLTGQDGSEIRLAVSYKTDVAGTMKVYYTLGGGYEEDYSDSADIAGEGEAEFIIEAVPETRIRLDIPEGSTVEIRSLRICGVAEDIEYGYDTAISPHHRHTLGYLPVQWAENDTKNAADNPVQAVCRAEGGYYRFDNGAVTGEKGNYLALKASWDGDDGNGFYREDDENTTATLVFGLEDGEGFREKYRYDLNIREGEHEYLIRCSTDYYWYLGEVNAIQLSCRGRLYDVDMSILEGD